MLLSAMTMTLSKVAFCESTVNNKAAAEHLFRIITKSHTKPANYALWAKIYGNNDLSKRLFNHYDVNQNGIITNVEYVSMFLKDAKCKRDYDKNLLIDRNSIDITCFVLK